MNKMIIGVDFDGTCVENMFPYVGKSIGAEHVLKQLSRHHKLILYTVRDGVYLAEAIKWFNDNGISLYSANFNPNPVSSSQKLYCDYYIDDRNIGTPIVNGHVDWEKMEVILKSMKLI